MSHTELPADVAIFKRDVEASFHKQFKNGDISVRQPAGSMSKGSIFIVAMLLPKGEQANGILQNDPCYMQIWIHDSFTDDGFKPRIKIEMSVGHRLCGSNFSRTEKTGWRNGSGTPLAIARKLEKYFMKLRAMVDARDDLNID